jgi:hypothetical protein
LKTREKRAGKEATRGTTGKILGLLSLTFVLATASVPVHALAQEDAEPGISAGVAGGETVGAEGTGTGVVGAEGSNGEGTGAEGVDEQGSNGEAAGTVNANEGNRAAPFAPAALDVVTLVILADAGPAATPLVIGNTTYAFHPHATLQDLLDAAITEGEIQEYQLNIWGYLDSVTDGGGMKVEGADPYYWMIYVSGSAYLGSETMASLELQAGETYQLVWESWQTPLNPDWGALPAAAAGSTVAGMAGNGGGTAPGNTEPAPFDAARFAELYANIAYSYAGATDDWKAMDLAAANLSAGVNLDAIAANAVASFNSPGPTDLQRSILALTACNIDASTLVYGGNSYNLIESLSRTQAAHSLLTGQVFCLLAYECGPYAVPAGALADKDQLVNSILAAQLADGGFAWTGSSADADLTAMVVAALAPYRARADVQAALDDALAALRGLQLADGGFASLIASGSQADANSTAMVIIALCAMGIDPQGADWTVAIAPAGQAAPTGQAVLATPLSALLSLANANYTGFLSAGNADMATEQGFRALVAYQGFLNTRSAYNVYTMARLGSAGLPAGNALPGNGSAGQKGRLAPTGDRGAKDTVQILAQGAMLAACVGLVLAVRGNKRKPCRYEANTKQTRSKHEVGMRQA